MKVATPAKTVTVCVPPRWAAPDAVTLITVELSLVATLPWASFKVTTGWVVKATPA